MFKNRPEVIDSYKKLDDAGLDAKIINDPDWLTRVDDWQRNGVNVQPDPNDIKVNLFSANDGSKIAEVSIDGKLLPEKYDYPASANGTPVGQPANGYQVYKNGNEVSVRRVPDKSAYSQSELTELTQHPDAHVLERHGHDVTDEALQKRATTGFAPDGSRSTRMKNGIQEIYIPPKSTRFNDAASVKKALAAVEPESAAYNAKYASISPGEPSFIVEFDFGSGNSIGNGFQVSGTQGWHPASNLPLPSTPTKITGLYKVKAVY